MGQVMQAVSQVGSGKKLTGTGRFVAIQETLGTKKSTLPAARTSLVDAGGRQTALTYPHPERLLALFSYKLGSSRQA